MSPYTRFVAPVLSLCLAAPALPLGAAEPGSPPKRVSREMRARGESKVPARAAYMAARRRAAPGIDRALARAEALRLKARSAAKRPSVTALGTVWAPIGPAPVALGQTNTNGGARANVSGRFTGIAAGGGAVYVSAAQGGVWKTVDNGTTWTSLGDGSFGTLAIGAIAVDPQSTNTVWVGTGEANGALDNYGGEGVWKSTDGGLTWSGPLPASSNPFTGVGIGAIAVDRTNSQRVLACTHQSNWGSGNESTPGTQSWGVYRTTDGGTTWTNETAGSFNCSNLVQDPVNASRWFAAMDQIGLPAGSNTFNGGLLRSTDGGDTWIQLAGNPSLDPSVTQPLPPNSGVTPNEWLRAWVTASAASGAADNAVTVYVGMGMVNANPTPDGHIWKSTDSGLNWTELTNARGYCAPQCFYDLPVYAVPTAPNTVLHGGAANDTTSGSSIASLRVSTNGGSGWTDRNTGLHSDMHFAVAEPGSTTNLWLANDGGIWRSTDTGQSWTNVNTNLSVTQFVGFDLDPVSATVAYGGTQDNGTNCWSGSDTWFHSDDGDGGYCVINQATPTNVAHTYFNLPNVLIGAGVGFTGPSTPPSGYTFVGNDGSRNNGINLADRVLFYPPFVRDPGALAARNTVYFGTNKLYRATDFWTKALLVQGGALNTPIFTDISGGQDFGSPNASISAIEPVANVTVPGNEAQHILVGTGDGSIWYTTNGGTNWTSSAGAPGVFVSDFAVDPSTLGNPASVVVYASASGFISVAGRNVIKSTNGGVSWAYSGTGLPLVPVNTVLVDPVVNTRVWAGTDVGVFLSTDSGATWSDYSAGMPNVAVWDLKASGAGAGDMLVAATHGRGMYRLTPLTPAALTRFEAE